MSSVVSVLCYVRPWNSEQFSFLASELVPGAQVIRCSEHRAFDDAGICKSYYANLKQELSRKDFDLFKGEDAEMTDIIMRCRLLRKLSEKEAKRHVLAMGLAILDTVERLRPAMILSLTIDSFVMDLLRFVAKLKGVRFVAFIGTFVNGYYRVSARGEPNFYGAPDSAVIEELKGKLLKDDYAPAFNARSLSNPRKSVCRRWAANIVRVPYFWFKRIFSGEYYNYHYWVSQLVSAEQFHMLPPKDPGDFEWLKKLSRDSRPSIFIPLQMFPECTVDYWCQDVKVIDYYRVLDHLVERLALRFNVIIKEHPSVMGSRPSGFYSKLAKDSRVIVVPTYTPSNTVLREVDSVLVWTGSVGFESLLRGKAVFGLAKPFYASGDRFYPVESDADLEGMLRHIEYCQSNSITPYEQDALLSYLAGQLLKGDFLNDGTWSISNEQHLAQAKGVVASYLNSHSVSAQ